MYAIIQSGGKQYKVEEGNILRLEMLRAEEGSRIELTDVLMLKTDGQTHIGTPLIKGAKVEATVLKTEKDRKVVVFKFKRRKQYKRSRGHRQIHTKVKVERISLGV